jgi:hypothetical protein
MNTRYVHLKMVKHFCGMVTQCAYIHASKIVGWFLSPSLRSVESLVCNIFTKSQEISSRLFLEYFSTLQIKMKEHSSKHYKDQRGFVALMG